MSRWRCSHRFGPWRGELAFGLRQQPRGRDLRRGSSSGTTARVVGQATIFGFGGNPLIRIPFEAGDVGTTVSNEGGVQVSVFAQGWTSGTLAIDDGSGGTLATATGTVSSGTPGSVTLVSGARVETSLSVPTFVLHTLHLEFERLAPEPAGLLTLSVAGFVLAVRARGRRP